MSQNKFERTRTDQTSKITEIEEESVTSITKDKSPISSGKKPPRPRDQTNDYLLKSETTSTVHPIKNVRKTSHSPY